jgi:hypothetical protein
MDDPKLEDEIERVKECSEMLRRFHDIFDKAVLTETVVPEDEGKFQELRAELPLRWEALFKRLGLPVDPSVDVAVQTADSLSIVVGLTEFQKRKLYDSWHKAYMRLHLLLGRLQHRKERLKAFRPGKFSVGKLRTGPVLVIIAVVLAIVAGIVLYLVLSGK